MDLYTYRVISYRVVDGDTLDVTLDLGFNTFRKEKVRLARINAPEMKNDSGPIAKSYLSDLLSNGIVTIQTKRDEKDRYGRYIAEVWIEKQISKDAKKLLNVNDAMLANGKAIPYV